MACLYASIISISNSNGLFIIFYLFPDFITQHALYFWCKSFFKGLSSYIQTFISNNKKFTLIGYTFHCYNSKTEQEIVDHLSILENEKILDEIDNLCGHFVLISNKKELKIYTDACSSFKVFYGKSDKYSFIGSDPKILCQFHDLGMKLKWFIHISRKYIACKTNHYDAKTYQNTDT